MKRTLLALMPLALCLQAQAQTNPAISSWLINNTLKARHYVQGNSTPINDADLVNVQSIKYSSNYVYITTTGLPSYVTGPFIGNPSIAENQNAIFKMPLNGVTNSGKPMYTTGGNIGIFINGVALFDSRDMVSWNNETKSLCGGPGGMPCPGGRDAIQAWNRDAIIAERGGFDCSKAHPAMGNYHHHQNPSAFNLDKVKVSDICNLYNADGLYAIDSTKHSPLLGFAYDGFPIYGAYGYKNKTGDGVIVRMRSSYTMNTGTTRLNGPDVSTTYPLGYFREDNTYYKQSSPEFLDEHNGRFCVTPEYPNGTYCYFCTVDENWNSAYPYIVGPTFYGSATAEAVKNIDESVTTYTGIASANPQDLKNMKLTVLNNTVAELIMIQLEDINKQDLNIDLIDMSGKLVSSTRLLQGSTIAHFDTRTLYPGRYIVRLTNGISSITKSVMISGN